MSPRGTNRLLVVGSTVLWLVGCRKPQSERGEPAAPAPSAAAMPAQPGAPRPKVEPWPVAVGPALPVQPGKGLGPVRFGATVSTVERLMGAPCDERQALPEGDALGATEVCHYFSMAVDYYLGPGGVVRMHAHRAGRTRGEALQKHPYGVFNGRFLEGVAMGMLPDAVMEELGRPLRVQPVAEPGPFQTVEIYHYAAFRLEFDRLESGEAVLGGIDLLRPAQTEPVKQQ